MLNGIGNEIKNEKSAPRYRECALEALRLLSKHPTCPDKVKACDGLRAALERIAADDSEPRMQSKAADILDSIAPHPAAKAGGPPTFKAAQASAPKASRSMFAAASATATRPKMRTVTVDMTGLLPLPGAPGAKQVVDAYTHALLLVPGVTSVSIDTASFRAVVFVRCASAEDVRPGLLAAVNGVREVQLQQERDAAGGGAHDGSPSVPSSSALMYLDEDEEDDFFGDGAVAERRGRETVEERLARQRREQEKLGESSADEGVLGGIAKGVASWMGMGW